MEDPISVRVREYADQAVQYVRRALGMTLEYDSDTLPVLDHYLRTVTGGAQAEALELVITTAGSYFGEVVRRRLGGRWEITGRVELDGDDDRPPRSNEAEWRVVLPTGLNFSPLGFVASAIAQGDVEEFDSEFDAPARMRPYVQQTLARMGEVPLEDYYSLCNRLDTLEHVHEVLVAVAAQMMGDATDPDADEPAEPGEPEAVAPVADEPSGPVN
ncbi:MAG TPA: hypothetical protein VIV58_08255 [Kofleriaceae bacterium]